MVSRSGTARSSSTAYVATPTTSEALERRKPVPSARNRDLVGRVGRGLKVVATLDDLDAESSHRRVLLDAISGGNHHRGRDSVTPGGEADGLSMIPSCRGNDTARADSAAAKRVHVDEAAANLECSRRRVVLVLHPHRGANTLVEERPPVLRCRRHRLVDEPGRRVESLERRLVFWRKSDGFE